MKKLLLLPLLLLSVFSCTSNEDSIQPNENSSISEISKKYEAHKIKKQNEIGHTYNLLTGKRTRSESQTAVSGAEFLQLLSTMPSETVDSLYQQYCTPEIEQEYEDLYYESMDKLIEQTSAEEVQQLHNFARSYIEQGGNNMNFLSESIQNRPAVIQECMIRCAASIDEYLDSVRMYPIEFRGPNSYCFYQLILKIAESSVENEIIGTIEDALLPLICVPGFDVAVALISEGLDLYDALKLAHEYNMCCATHVS